MKQDKEIFKNIWDEVAPNFGEIGPKYWSDFGNRLVELSNINKGARVLDIGMGRGASLFPTLNRIGKDGSIVGIDYSEVMVSKTQKDILSRNINNAEVKKMNAQNLEFADSSFDNIICGFGIGYLLFGEDKLNGVKRILKDNGQVAFSIWGVQENQKWLTEIINKYIPPTNNTSHVNSLKFDTVDYVKKILEQAGFKNIKVHEESSDVIYKNKEEWWQEMCTNAVRGIFNHIEKLGEDEFKNFKEDVFNGLEVFNRGDGVHFNMPVIYAFGEK